MERETRMLIKELMTKGVDSIKPDCTILEAARHMKRHNVGMLPIVEYGRVAGVVTDRDIVVRAVAKGACLETTTVAEIMTRNPVHCGDEDDLKDVARIMEAKKVRRVPVLDARGKLVGILSLGDFAKRLGGQDLVGEVLEAVAARHG